MKPEYDEDLIGFLVAFWGIIFPIGVFGMALFTFWGYQDVKDWVDRQREKTQIERSKEYKETKNITQGVANEKGGSGKTILVPLNVKCENNKVEVQ